jgi:hypothetical protein
MPAGVLVSQAMSFKLEVFPPTIHCDGNDIDVGGASADLSRTFAMGEAIKLSIPPGQHTLRLSTYSDAASADVTGTSCSEQNLPPGGEICFDFKVEPAKGGCQHTSGRCCEDADCTVLPSPAACYVGMCPAPDSKCNYNPAPKAIFCGSRCCNALNGNCENNCNLTCSGKNLNCNSDTSDGCEIAGGSDPKNCGSCGRECQGAGKMHVQAASCSNGLCNSTCELGYANCKQPSIGTDDGCECTTPGCCANNCQSIHSDGFGHNFYDCSTLGFYSSSQATLAASGYTTGGTVSMKSATDSNGVRSDAVCNLNTTDCVCWAYAGLGRGRAQRNLASSPPKDTDCVVPTASGGSTVFWQ